MTSRERVRSRSRIRSKVAIAILIVSLVTVSFLGAIIIPLYTYPGVDWTAIAAAKEANPGVGMVVIINPDNGPGQSRDQNYVNGVNELVAAGVVVIGYDHTSYAARSISVVEADMNTYKSWYNISGIFFDEMSSVPGNENYYSTLNQYAKSIGLPFTVGNPGTRVPAGYIGTLDVIVTYENQGVPNSTSLATMTNGLPKNDFAVIAYGVSAFNASAVGDIFNYANYVYVTNGTQPNPYGVITGDFSKLVSLLSGLAYSPPSVALTVKSVNAAGTPVVGLWTVIKSANGSAVASGYTPLTYSVHSGAGYAVSVANFGNFVFSHWGGGSTNPTTTLTMTQATTLTAYYDSSSSTSTNSSTSTSASSSSSPSTSSSTSASTSSNQSTSTGQSTISSSSTSTSISTSSSSSTSTSQSTSTNSSTSTISSIGTGSIMIVQSVVFNSAPLSGPWAVIKLSGGTLIASSYTPFSIIATGGAAYTVSMSDYGCFVFSHWGDGSTNPTTTVTLTQATTLTAYYTTDFNCALWAYLYPIS